ncbi:hypothetical protein L596_013498 [Steinernema carpocapsae]|uniref:Activator of Hsp90 ATPase AHSA1-like N-terminal domain-containing protein n=1 Tax=Steinernema carpocapsae TaxID=34508 RepID=A0A4U5P0U6_STECR|nr:hypothetical protein L596_013498 [Steinernema carpocapsae]
MAKWGEGDPRWICEERPDATNVNNWHWTEKNATPWSKNRLPELLTGFSVESGAVKFDFTEIKKLEGEATANNRKAKLIFLFEWVVEVKFNATIAGCETEYKGYIEIPNLSDENEAHEVDVNFNLDTKGPFEAQLRQIINGEGTKQIRDKLGVYIRELKEEFSKGLILPTDKPKQQVVSKGKTSVVDKKSFQNLVITDKKDAKAVPNGTVSCNVPTKKYETKETFKCSPDTLFDILTTMDLAQKWSSGSLLCDAIENGKGFSLFNGQVAGTFGEIKKNDKIEMYWRLKAYPGGYVSKVTFSVHDQGDGTQLKISATDIPESHFEEVQNAFNRFYLQSIARTFGFSMRPV